MSLVESMFNFGGKHLSWGNVFDYGATGYFGLDAYKESRKQGSGVVASAADAALGMAMPIALGLPGYFAFEAATHLPGAAMDFYKWQRDYRRQLGAEQRQKAFQSMSFQDNQQTYTMRQAAMAISERSRYNTQSAMLGNEAQYMLK